MAQAEIFLKAINEDSNAAMRSRMIAARCANTDNKSFKKILKELD